MIKVLIVGPDIQKSSVRGGQVTHIKTLIECFNGCDSVALSHFSNGSGMYNSESFSRKAFRLLNSYFHFFNIIKEFDVIHLNTTIDRRSIFRDFIYCFISSLRGRKYVIQVHGGAPSNIKHYGYLYKYFAGFILDKSRKCLLFNYSKCGDLFTVSDKLILASNFVLKRETFPIKEALNFDGSKIRFCYLGRVDRLKGIFELMEWLKITNYSNLISSLTIIGDGPDKEEVMNLSSKINLNIHFTGFLDGDEKLKVLANADFLLLPSYQEAFPYSVIEALSLGVPVISTNVGSIDRIIADKKNGFILKGLDCSHFDEILKLITESNFCYYNYHCEALRTSKLFDGEAMIDYFQNIWFEVGK